MTDADGPAGPGDSGVASGDTAPAAEPASAPAAAPPRRRRPAAFRRPGAVALYFAYRAAAALVLAAPLSVLAARFWGGYPRADAVLFDPGALTLVETARRARAVMAPLAVQLGLGGMIASALGLLPLAFLIVALGREHPLSVTQIGARVAKSVGPLTLLWGVAVAAEVVLAALTFVLGSGLVAQLDLAPRSRDLAQLGVAALALAAVAAVGVVHDLARVAAVDEGRGFHAAASRALGVARRAPLAAGAAYAARVVLTLLAFACAALVASRIGVATAPRVALGLLVHHVAVALGALLRASWLAAAMRLLDRTSPPPAGQDRGNLEAPPGSA